MDYVFLLPWPAPGSKIEVNRSRGKRCEKRVGAGERDAYFFSRTFSCSLPEDPSSSGCGSTCPTSFIFKTTVCWPINQENFVYI